MIIFPPQIVVLASLSFLLIQFNVQNDILFHFIHGSFLEPIQSQFPPSRSLDAV